MAILPALSASEAAGSNGPDQVPLASACRSALRSCRFLSVTVSTSEVLFQLTCPDNCSSGTSLTGKMLGAASTLLPLSSRSLPACCVMSTEPVKPRTYFCPSSDRMAKSLKAPWAEYSVSSSPVNRPYTLSFSSTPAGAALAKPRRTRSGSGKYSATFLMRARSRRDARKVISWLCRSPAVPSCRLIKKSAAGSTLPESSVNVSPFSLS